MHPLETSGANLFNLARVKSLCRARRAAKEAKEAPAQPAPEKVKVEVKKFVKIGRPGYKGLSGGEVCCGRHPTSARADEVHCWRCGLFISVLSSLAMNKIWAYLLMSVVEIAVEHLFIADSRVRTILIIDCYASVSS